MRKIIFSTLATTIMVCETSFGQGCSDAGFCTINNVKPVNFWERVEPVKNQIKAGFFFGKGDNSVNVWGNYLEYNRQVSDVFSFDAKVTSIAQNGNGIRSFGLSDILISGNYQINERLGFTLGTKIPLSDGNKKQEGLSLPMDYQPSLGTLDAIMALSYQINKLHLVFAWQQPILQNKNEFLAEIQTNNLLKKFQSTRNYERAGDILLRASYPIAITDKFKLTPSILPIYHLTNDRFTDISGIKQSIEGSKGLTLNGNIYLDYQINAKNSLQLNAGMPFITRKARPDGLTRHFVANLEYRIRF
ncbi:hypothetical protein [Capnocytophaga felis]|uniref:Uncharacterized protein n=1 Tax=Capnocytophaga felis TaxID=2267611 RepID=A0A5M4B613_9FLAO|nr:hypothetical protein [Capnocytophaga felis]GET45009.1 hypothetical protein RCZ01_03110 [Capnocytophaga felis]GET47828.1 hypothetical protein RCZ02_06590 [Capnocytophaga felis]